MVTREILVFADPESLGKRFDGCYQAYLVASRSVYPIEWVGFRDDGSDHRRPADFDDAMFHRVAKELHISVLGGRIAIAVVERDEADHSVKGVIWRRVSAKPDAFNRALNDLAKAVRTQYDLEGDLSIGAVRILEAVLIGSIIACAYIALLNQDDDGILSSDLWMVVLLLSFALWKIHRIVVWRGRLSQSQFALKRAMVLSFLPGLGLVSLGNYRRGIPYLMAGIPLAVALVYSVVKIIELKAGYNDAYVDMCIAVGIWGMTVAFLSVYDTQLDCLELGLDPESIWADTVNPWELATMPLLLLFIAVAFAFCFWDRDEFILTKICWLPVLIVLILFYIDKKHENTRR